MAAFLQKQNVDIKLRGLNTKSDARLSVAGTLTDVQNARYDKGDADSGVRISKRWGSTAVDTANQPSRIFSVGNKAYSIRSSAGENIFELRGNGSFGPQTMGRMGAPMAWASTVRGAVNVGTDIEPSWVVDSAFLSGSTIVYLLNESDGQRVIWYDSEAEKIVASYKSTAATADRARIIVVGAKVIVALFKASTTNIKIYEFTTTSATLQVTISSVYSTWPNVAWDWAAAANGVDLYVAYVETTSSSTLKMTQINTASWGTGATSTWAAGAAVTAVGVAASTTIRVFWANTTDGVKTRTYNNVLANTLGTTVVEAAAGETRRAIGVAMDTADVAYVAWNVSENVALASTRWHNRIHYATVSTLGVTGTIVKTRGAGLASKPYRFTDGGTERVFVLGALGVTTDSGTAPIAEEQKGYVFLEVSQTFALRARMLHLTAGISPASTSSAQSSYNRFGLLPNLHTVGDPTLQGATRVFGCAGVSFDSDPSAAEVVASAPTARLLSCSMTPTIGYFAAEHDGCLLVTGGVLHSFDGATMRENGFVTYPTITKITPNTSGGGINDGTYSVVVMFERVDARGRVVESGISPPSTAVISGGGGNGSITVTATTYRLGLADGDTERIVVFISGAGGTTHRRIDVEVNTRTLDESEFLLITGATLVADEAIVYTDSGEDDHTQPSAPVALCVSGDRLSCVAGDDRYRMQRSKPLGSGIGPAFYPEFFRPVASKDGPITALSSVIGATLAFKARSMFVVGGDGPDALGNNDTLGDFVERSQKLGALTQRHIISDGDATYAYGYTGIHRVGPGGAVEYVGAPVEDYVNLAPVGSPSYVATLNDLRDACFVHDRKELHFATENGVELVYNTEFGQWTTNPRIFASSVISLGGLRYFIADAAYVADVYGVAATVTGGIYKETPGLWNTDAHLGAERHKLSITTGWIKLDGLAGFGRAFELRVLAGALGASWSLDVSFGFDNADALSAAQSITIPTVATADGTTPAAMPSAFFPQQKCSSFRTKLVETVAASELQGAVFYGLAAIMGIYPGGRRVPAASHF